MREALIDTDPTQTKAFEKRLVRFTEKLGATREIASRLGVSDIFDEFLVAAYKKRVIPHVLESYDHFGVTYEPDEPIEDYIQGYMTLDDVDELNDVVISLLECSWGKDQRVYSVTHSNWHNYLNMLNIMTDVSIPVDGERYVHLLAADEFLQDSSNPLSQREKVFDAFQAQLEIIREKLADEIEILSE